MLVLLVILEFVIVYITSTNTIQKRHLNFYGFIPCGLHRNIFAQKRHPIFFRGTTLCGFDQKDRTVHPHFDWDRSARLIFWEFFWKLWDILLRFLHSE